MKLGIGVRRTSYILLGFVRASTKTKPTLQVEGVWLLPKTLRIFRQFQRESEIAVLSVVSPEACGPEVGAPHGLNLCLPSLLHGAAVPTLCRWCDLAAMLDVCVTSSLPWKYGQP